MTEGAITSARRVMAALHAEGGRQRDAAVHGMAAGALAAGAPTLPEVGGAGPETVPLAIVPRHAARLRRVAARRHAAFEARLRALLAFVRSHPAHEDDRTLDQPAPLSDVGTRVVAAVCSACRGACCGNGGDHAFLRTRTLRDFVASHPHLDDDAVVTAYRRHLPERALHPGCVYQGAGGCTLPREMRSAICNAYLCGGLRRALAESGEATMAVFVAHRRGEHLSGGRVRALPVLRDA